LNFKLFGLSGLILLLVQIIPFCTVPVHAQDSTRQEVLIHFQTLNRPARSPEHSADFWYADDKFRHLLGSFFSTTLLAQLSGRDSGWNKREAKIFAAGTTISLGFVKELYDRKRPGNHFCWKDLAANAGGVLLGLIILGIK
jgi:uncharacterized protein YfiM (DUF2279 family)